MDTAMACAGGTVINAVPYEIPRRKQRNIKFDPSKLRGIYP